MTTTRGVNNTAAQPGTAVPAVTGGQGGGRLAVIYDYRVLTASDLQNGIIVMGPDKALKKGDIVHGVALDWDALGAGATLSVGDDGSAARYQAAQDASAAGQNRALKNGAIGYTLTQDRDIYVTIGGANPTVGATVRLSMTVLRA